MHCGLPCRTLARRRVFDALIKRHGADHFIGHSAVFAPDGTTLASLGAGEGLLVTEIAGTEEEEEGEEE